MRHNLNKESENTDRWLVSYADFITLLFAFFVVMYSVSQVNEGKFKILSETLTDAFVQPERSLQPIQIGEVNKADTATSGDSTYPTDYFGEPAAPETDQAFEELREDLATSFKELIDEDIIKIRSNQDWIDFEVKSNKLFASGSAVLESGVLPLLEVLAEKYKDKPNAIKIRGYTDDIKINTSRFPSNWALSSARAGSVAQFFEQKGIDPSRMTVEGYGEHQPLNDNSTPDKRRANRRVVMGYSRYAPAKSELERQAINEASNETTTINPVTEDDSTVNIVRAPDGSLIIRGRNDNNNTNDDNN